ncbi:succinate dehydrogenase cytochrome b subunit [Iamia sp. SCSIO 61187]|uniref:succinate dehydrogenase cytochrome b subunit n=1 Tax=Iamia sp. SCSIO 61187 TaxID=2722752 RepID=UPI001C6361BB|nr:succinate dehydrogenase cytochrome b subunit [Iamia sp. SCSIO 61187]QYG91315.1 succinate dehydrogenase cytochrome b subunit [Iamia sp. SCSIO 61187]
MAATTATRGSSGSATAPRAKRKAPFPVELYRSAVGKKYVMALTGIVIIGFVFFHMIGNLKMFLGAEDFNHYGEFLRELLVPILPRTVALWLMRIGLIAAFALHIHSAYALTRINQAARHTKYQSKRDYVAANYASRTMRWSGVIVGLFLVWHLFDLTFTGTGYDYVRGLPYENVALSLGRIWNAAFYLVANIALGFHLFHGTWSLFQSMGWNNPRFNAWRRGFAAGLTAIIVLGNVSFPIAVTAGIVST